ncbi:MULTISPECIES: RNA polymerase sigma factor [Acidiphilium]|uniref:RNA polymerase sigma-70 factor, ECF subfamily n=1 Tax=Acidiphilium rubrum TaxID=526 RepID=A0A8G2FHU0_ACIRU|nr:MULTISPECIES: RNA polymerase sigma factor [Acidiphilium]MCW8308729.1 RNA polymerase sigma factor [Acidiphilium sp. PA]SIR52046.1 RNA polymerase sigma-70 factor, ECF subfamily [Acidiphilium rubrum]
MTVLSKIEETIPSLRRYASALLGGRQDADDLVHDCLVLALAHIKPRMTESEVRPWLFTIIRNHFISGRRKIVARGTSIDIDEAAALMPATAPVQEQRMQMHELSKGLAALPDDQREVFLLITLEGFEYAEVAAMLGIPLGTVMSRLSRARDHLRDFMDGRARPALRRVK